MKAKKIEIVKSLQQQFDELTIQLKEMKGDEVDYDKIWNDRAKISRELSKKSN